MLGGYRSIVIAIVGWLSLAAAQPEKAAPDPQAASRNQVAESLNEIATALKNQAESSELEKPCDKGNDNRSSDLCAQWKAADAASLAADVAWWVAIVGTLIGALTLATAFKAAQWARRAAEETKRTADLATDTSAADLRPYLFVERLELRRAEPAFAIEVFFRNFGKLPARNIMVKIDCYFSSAVEHVRADVLKAMPIAIPVCAPGHERRVFGHLLLNEEELKAHEAGYGGIVVRIRYRYRGGPRKRPYGEKADYAYHRSVQDGGYFYLLTPQIIRSIHESGQQEFSLAPEEQPEQ